MDWRIQDNLEPPDFKTPVCPVCGVETDTLYKDTHTGEIVGCDDCLTTVDAWEYQAEHEEDYDD